PRAPDRPRRRAAAAARVPAGAPGVARPRGGERDPAAQVPRSAAPGRRARGVHGAERHEGALRDQAWRAHVQPRGARVPMRLLIRDARILDGTGAPATRGDVLIEGEHVAEVGSSDLAPDEVLDAAGMVLAPGFIDMHSHGDFTLPGDGEASAKTLQGVTTEVVGNCGLGLTPANARVERFYELISPVIFGEQGGGCFGDLDEYRRCLEGRGISVNAACLVPHGNVRCAVMGMEERDASTAEIAHMCELVTRCMEQGAFGLSTGLVYPPGAFASTEE